MITRSRGSQAEQCATCRAPVVVGPHTTRARYSGRPLCDSCGPTPLEERFRSDGGSGSRGFASGETRAYTERARCDGCGQMRPKKTLEAVGSGERPRMMCKNCRERGMNHITAMPGAGDRAEAYVDRVLEARASLSAEQRLVRDAYLQAVADDGEVPVWLERAADEVLFGNEERDDGVYGPETGGLPVEGVQYETRWWNPGWIEAEERTCAGGEVRVYPGVEWVLS